MTETAGVPSDPKEASTAEVAACCGVTTEAIIAWKAKIDRANGIWREVKAGRGKGGMVLVWDLPRFFAWRMDQAATAAANKVRPLGEMSPLEQEQLRKLQLQNDERAGKLVSRAELDSQWAKVGGELRQQLETVGRRHGPTVSNDIARVIKNLAQRMHGLLGKP